MVILLGLECMFMWMVSRWWRLVTQWMHSYCRINCMLLYGWNILGKLPCRWNLSRWWSSVSQGLLQRNWLICYTFQILTTSKSQNCYRICNGTLETLTIIWNSLCYVHYILSLLSLHIMKVIVFLIWSIYPPYYSTIVMLHCCHLANSCLTKVWALWVHLVFKCSNCIPT